MKLAIMAPIAFVVGLGAGAFAMKGSGASPATGDKPPAATNLDSLAPPTTAPVKVDTSVTKLPDTTVAAQPKPGSVPARGKIDATPPAPKEHSDAKHLASVLSKLSAEDALLLVRGLSDDDLVAVLKNMDLAKAGAILAALPASRSAVLSKRISGGNAPAKP